MARLRAPLLVVLVAAAIGLAVLAGARLAGPDAPADDSVDAGFLRDMQVHHAQAVEMSVLVRDRTDDERVRGMALDIALGQQQQMGQMYALLGSWDLSQQPAAGEQMAWMSGHSGHSMAMGSDGLMPGMATDDQLDELRAASGEEAERLWLGLMITHHEAGVEMAEAGEELADDDQVRRLASSMAMAQTAETRTMQEMLADRTR
ncbi:DUF305 domain-containing protein [Nocardioides marmoraquaticus]